MPVILHYVMSYYSMLDHKCFPSFELRHQVHQHQRVQQAQAIHGGTTLGDGFRLRFRV